MNERLKALLLRTLKVPPEPSPPEGEAGSLRVFRAAPPYLLYRRVLWGLRQLGAVAALCIGLLFIDLLLSHIDPKDVPYLPPLLLAVEGAAWALFLLQVPFTFAVLNLDYELRWYMVTDRGLRIREGILSLREKTMTFANVQQLSVEQGPLQRLLGIADVQVRSAGGGAGRHGKDGEPGAGESLHEARFRGVANAGEIRDLIRECVRLHRDAGLGDLGDPAPLSADADAKPDVLAAAHEVLDEVRGLRAALTRPRD